MDLDRDIAVPKTVFVLDHDLDIVFQLRETGEDQSVDVVHWDVDRRASPDQLKPPARKDGIQCAVVRISLLTNGIQDLRRLCELADDLPIIVLSDDASVQTAVAAVRAGAVQYLAEPVDSDTLWNEIDAAFEVAVQGRKQATSEAMQRLTDKERDVLNRIVAGQSNREMAQTFELSVRGVEHRRSQIARKLQVSSMRELLDFMRQFSDSQINDSQINDSQINATTSTVG